MANQSAEQWIVIQPAGHQFLTKVGHTVVSNSLPDQAGAEVKLTDLLTGQPVMVKVIAHRLGDKVRGLKFKNKVRYLKRYGHRQPQTELEVISIGSSVAAKKAEPTATKPKPKASVKAKTPTAPLKKTSKKS